jgi:hypothetical protein
VHDARRRGAQGWHSGINSSQVTDLLLHSRSPKQGPAVLRRFSKLWAGSLRRATGDSELISSALLTTARLRESVLLLVELRFANPGM